MSARLEYKVEALREQIDKKYDNDIEAARKKYMDAIDIGTRVATWRVEAEERLLAMAAQINSGDYLDAELSGFSIKSMPTSDRYGRSPESVRESSIKQAEETHKRSLVRLDSMVTQGSSLWLTTTMLHDLFGL